MNNTPGYHWRPTVSCLHVTYALIPEALSGDLHEIQISTLPVYRGGIVFARIYLEPKYTEYEERDYLFVVF